LPVERGDPYSALGRPLLEDRDRKRELLGCKRSPPSVRRRERGGPFLERHHAGLLEAAAEQLLGRLVVEQQVAVGIDDEDRRREVRRQLTHQNHFERLGSHRVLFTALRGTCTVTSGTPADIFTTVDVSTAGRTR